MLKNKLNQLTINGFKSIKVLENFELKDLNVMIGGNGAGKSNLISFFKLLNYLMNGYLNRYVRENGGASDILFQGRKITEYITFEAKFGDLGFRFKLSPTASDRFMIEDEAIYSLENGWQRIKSNEDAHSGLLPFKDSMHCLEHQIYQIVSSWQIYHFHDTSNEAKMRNYEIVEDHKSLRMDAANLAPFLLNLKEKYPKSYKEIIHSIQLVMPFFNDFILEPREMGSKRDVNLSWTRKDSNYPFQPYHLSDGSIRFICLTTALLQPNPPTMMIFDEPELGLHPTAIFILAEMMQLASQHTQIMIATQSPTLIDYFEINDMIVVNQDDGASVFKRLDENDFSEWIKHYSLSELWIKNVI